MDAKPFSVWIKEKYKDFQEKNTAGTRNASLTAFARQFGAPHQVVLAWMRDASNPPREPRYVARLIAIYGDEAYEAMGIPTPGRSDGGNILGLTENERKALDLIRQVPPDYQQDALENLELFLLRHGFRRVS